MAFKIQAVVLLAVILIMAMAPLVFFVPRLAKFAAIGNHAVRDTGADSQHGLP
jgi:hypothetical protein